MQCLKENLEMLITPLSRLKTLTSGVVLSREKKGATRFVLVFGALLVSERHTGTGAYKCNKNVQVQSREYLACA